MRLIKAAPKQPEDPRDFVMRSMAPSAPPPSNFRLPPRPVFNQGNLGSCTAFAALTTLSYTPNASGAPTANLPTADPYQQLSQRFLYRETSLLYSQPPKDKGAYLRDVAKTLAKKGSCLLPLCPYDTSPLWISPPSTEAYDDALNRQLISYTAIRPNQIRQNVSQGRAVFFAMDTDTSLYSATALIPVPRKAARDCPFSHAMAIVGYTPDKFLVHNSWGLTWGSQGKSYLRESTLLSHCRDFWVFNLTE